MSVGRQFIYATSDSMFDHFQTRVVQLLDQAKGGGQQVGALQIVEESTFNKCIKSKKSFLPD